MRRTVLHSDFDLCVNDHVDQHAVFWSADKAGASALQIVQSVLAPARLAAKMLTFTDCAPPFCPLSCRLVFNSPGAQ